MWSEIVVKISLRFYPAAHAEDVTGQAERRQLDICARTLPEKASTAQQILRFERPAGIDPERLQIERQPSRLRMRPIEIDHHDDHIRQIFRCLAVTDQVRIVGLVEDEAVI